MPGLRALGAVLAGGRAVRFGADKAMALLDGKPLIDHVIARIEPQVDEIVICGRGHGEYRSLPDRPATGLGPLGGLCAALHYAARQGFDGVLSVGCDTPLLPANLVDCLAARSPAFVAEHQLIGFWPSTLAKLLDAHLAHEVDRSMRLWAQVAHARSVTLDADIPNVNTPSDLIALAAPDGAA